MATSSIHIDNGTSSMGIHNTRVFSPDYLILADKSVNDYKSYTKEHIKDLVIMAKADYKSNQKNNRSLPSNATLIKEAIVNLNDYHKIEDVEIVKDMLEKEYKYKISSISIHRDEGYIFNDKKNFTMGREQFKNIEETPYIAELDFKDNKFYEWKKEKGKWKRLEEVTDYEIKFNYHAHIEMLNYDFEAHRTIRNNLKALSKMQTFVADSLKMERGKCSSTVEAKRLGVEVEQSRKRMNIKDYKNYKRKENELVKELKKERTDHQELKYNFKEMQKKITSLEDLNSSQKKELHQLNSKVKNGKADFLQLQNELQSVKASNVSNEKEKRAYTQTIATLNSKNVSLQEEIEQFQQKLNIQAKKIMQLEEKNNNLTSLNEMKQKEIVTTKTIENPINKALEKENEELKASKNGLKNSFVNVIEKFVKVLNIPKVLNLSFFDSAVEKMNSILKENKTLQEQKKALNDKVIELENKKPSEQNIAYSEDVILVEDFDKNAKFAEKVNSSELNEIEKNLKKEELFKEHDDIDEANDILNSYNDENERGLEL